MRKLQKIVLEEGIFLSKKNQLLIIFKNSQSKIDVYLLLSMFIHQIPNLSLPMSLKDPFLHLRCFFHILMIFFRSLELPFTAMLITNNMRIFMSNSLYKFLENKNFPLSLLESEFKMTTNDISTSHH